MEKIILINLRILIHFTSLIFFSCKCILGILTNSKIVLQLHESQCFVVLWHIILFPMLILMPMKGTSAMSFMRINH